ncbi:hypothetical protein BDQ12DRAFT_728286 [Crucibulum laeve]|uniref:Uncharacterized protein n=1 Tax=Crucibulum laeve TaxID=68775 RepID=A0A5C3LJI8_9AGAR|nr:hypothetical protein BDQ12DRAFT_728286 [Crucibulum laeve]
MFSVSALHFQVARLTSPALFSVADALLGEGSERKPTALDDSQLIEITTLVITPRAQNPTPEELASAAEEPTDSVIGTG